LNPSHVPPSQGFQKLHVTKITLTWKNCFDKKQFCWNQSGILKVLLLSNWLLITKKHKNYIYNLSTSWLLKGAHFSRSLWGKVSYKDQHLRDKGNLFFGKTGLNSPLVAVPGFSRIFVFLVGNRTSGHLYFYTLSKRSLIKASTLM